MASSAGTSAGQSSSRTFYTNKNVCPSHPEAHLVEDYRAGDMICSECGLVVGDRVIDVGSEWRTFSANDKNSKTTDNSRVGGPENPLLTNDLSTSMIMPVGPGALNEDGSAKYQNRRQISSSDRTLIAAFREIVQMADRLNLPAMIPERAKVLFKQVHDTKCMKGKSGDAIASACLYIACRQEAVPRTFKEICAVSKVSKKDIGKCFKQIVRTLETSMELIKSGDFMSRFCSNLGLSQTIQRASIHIATKAVDLDLVPGRSPISVAAAAIYMACSASKEKKTQKEIGDIAGVAEVTIKQAYKLMLPRAKDLFPESFQFDTPVEHLPSN